MATELVRHAVSEDRLLVLLPYKGHISIMQDGTHLVYAKHDGADEGGDIETLKTLCLFRFNQGEQS